MADSLQDIDLYEVLEIDHGASKAEIKKAYHRAALSSHPDKVGPEERPEAEIRFKTISQAYEILYDDNKRHLYDAHGMSAFSSSGGGFGGMEAEVDLEDMFAQMFGMNMGGMGGMGEAGPGRNRQQLRGPDEEQLYKVTLEDLYKGKTAKFAVTKNVICSHCKGSGGKEKAKARRCSACQGQGSKQGLRSVGPGLVAPEILTCSSCQGRGEVFNPKDRCKKCKGERITQARKVLELYIPAGSKSGDRITLAQEADQSPLYETPGSLIFTLTQTPHETFKRSRSDLSATLRITLLEALCGFSRVVVRHLDGRALKVTYPSMSSSGTNKSGKRTGKTLTPGSVIKVPGEGMPIKGKSSKGTGRKGDLYLIMEVNLPTSNQLDQLKPVSSGEGKDQLKDLLDQLPAISIPNTDKAQKDTNASGPSPEFDEGEIEEVEIDDTATLDTFGSGRHGRGGDDDGEDGHGGDAEGNGEGDGEWYDDEEDGDDELGGEGHKMQCNQQ